MTETQFWIRFVTAMLAAWRITHLIAYEDGPADLIAHARARWSRGFAGRLLGCFQCLSMWVAAPLAWFVSGSRLESVVVWLALSGGACLLERAGGEPVVIQDLRAQGEKDHVLRPDASEPRR